MLITTVREIWEGYVKDAFLAKLESKLLLYRAPLIGHEVVPDDRETIQKSIVAWTEKGAEIIFCTGGMSVDADDVTPSAIQNVTTEVIFKGIPMLPGSNLMLARKDKTFVVGVPACAVHAQITALDTLMHRLYASLVPTEGDVRGWGVGGLCRSCQHCNYPACSFGARG